MTEFRIPLGALEHWVPAVPTEPRRVGELVTWRGLAAWYTDEEKALVRGLPAGELWVFHEAKALLDATILDEGKR